MPNFSCSTFTTGARQLVVQDAFEMTLCLAGSYMSSFTPSTMVTSSFFAGRRDDDLLHRAAQVLGGILGIGEPAGGFDHDLRADRTPVELGGILHGEDLDLLAADGNGIGVRA